MKWLLKYERSTCRLAARWIRKTFQSPQLRAPLFRPRDVFRTCGIVEMSVAVDDLKSIRSADCRRAGPCYIDRLDST